MASIARSFTVTGGSLSENLDSCKRVFLGQLTFRVRRREQKTIYLCEGAERPLVLHPLVRWLSEVASYYLGFASSLIIWMIFSAGKVCHCIASSLGTQEEAGKVVLLLNSNLYFFNPASRSL